MGKVGTGVSWQLTELNFAENMKFSEGLQRLTYTAVVPVDGIVWVSATAAGNEGGGASSTYVNRNDSTVVWDTNNEPESGGKVGSSVFATLLVHAGDRIEIISYNTSFETEVHVNVATTIGSLTFTKQRT